MGRPRRWPNIERKGYQRLHALVTFSGVVDDGGIAYTAADDPASGTAGAGQDRGYHVHVVAEKYQTGFGPLDETTIAEPADPNLLYASQTQVVGFDLLVDSEMDSSARDRYGALLAESRTAAGEFRSTLRNGTREHGFLAPVTAFHDPDLKYLHL